MDQNQLLIALQKDCPNVDFRVDDERVMITVLINRHWRVIAMKKKEENDDNWTINNDIAIIARNYSIFLVTEDRLLKENSSSSGAYLVVNTDGSKYMYENEDAALRGMRDEHAFVGIIGYTFYRPDIL